MLEQADRCSREPPATVDRPHHLPQAPARRDLGGAPGSNCRTVGCLGASHRVPGATTGYPSTLLKTSAETAAGLRSPRRGRAGVIGSARVAGRVGGMVSSVRLEGRGPQDRPPRGIRAPCDAAPDKLDPRVAALPSPMGRASIPPEMRLRATRLGALAAPARGAGRLRPSCSAASSGSGSGSGSGSTTRPASDHRLPRSGADLRGGTRSDVTHASATDPDARLHRKGDAREGRLAFVGHVPIRNQLGLAVGAPAARTTGPEGRRRRSRSSTAITISGAAPPSARTTRATWRRSSARSDEAR